MQPLLSLAVMDYPDFVSGTLQGDTKIEATIE
jgi:hypothetical protein